MSERDIPALEVSDRSEAALVADGWERGCITDVGRVADLVATYDEIGFDVLLLRVPLDDAGCTECMKNAPDSFRLIYTRRRAE